MKRNNDYKVFISFSMTDKDNERSKSYYLAKEHSRILNDLLGIKTYFCDKDLTTREQPDFQKELMTRVEKCEVFLLILLDLADYEKPYFKSERTKYIESHPNGEGIVILATPEVISRINNLDIMRLKKGHPDVHDISDTLSYQKCLNLINTLAHKGSKKTVDNIKVCKNCKKIFHDGNEVGTVCSYHPGKINYRGGILQFSCCNQKHKIESHNEVVLLSPGCCESEHDFVTFGDK